LNVASSSQVWLYYYRSFPLVKLNAGRCERLWKDFPIKGASAFAITDAQALFTGGYRDPERQHVFLVNLDSMSVDEFQPVAGNGEPLAITRAFGRGSKLCLQTEHDLYSTDLLELA
jgi:hypothetical protein